MKRIIAGVMAAAMLACAVPCVSAQDTDMADTAAVSGYVSTTADVASAVIADDTVAPKIYVDSQDWPGVIRAAQDLGEDIKTVTGRDAEVVNEKDDSVNIVAGTIGKSAAVDGFIAEGRIDVSQIEGKWESFTIQNVDGTIVIAGSDKRGTIYGIYDMSEKIGVSPWHYWADTVSGHADSLYANLPEGGYTEGEPSVQYRGIFLNDEWNMSEWSKSLSSQNMNNETYERIFELLLRLKANYLWPAMHTYSTAFNNTENNARLADEYGIVMGSSHCEPMLRNNLGELYNYQQEWTAANTDKTLYVNTTDDAKRQVSWMWTDNNGSGGAVDNKQFLSDYWRARVQENGGYENTYTLGMRGVHDGAFSTNMDQKTALTEIITEQRKILAEEIGTDGDISDIPQIFIPYKEILTLYNGGLEVPDDVTLMWPDDNFGYIRQLPTDAERERSGGAGIYYHLSYYGRPTSYIWLSTTQPGLIREEMTKAYDMGAQKVWVANVGDLKPAETEMEYFLDLARDVDGMRDTDIGSWLADNAKRDFGFNDEQAAEYADVKLGYYELANSRRPEHMVNGLFSLTAFGDEGQKMIDSYNALEARAEALYNGLPDEKKPSFYELMMYPLRGASSMAQKYIYSDKAQYYNNNGYGAAANKYAQLSDAAYQRVVDDTAQYSTMLDGKWDKMMNPYQSRLVGSFGGPISGKLSNPTVSTVPYTKLVTVAEGGADSLAFGGYSKNVRFIDIINAGSDKLDWKASSDKDWIVFNKTEGSVADDDRIYVGIDWDSVPEGVSEAQITIARYVGDTAVEEKVISVEADNTKVADIPEKAYIEENGYVSIEAEHYSQSVVNGESEWKVEKDFGRSGDSVKIYPNVGTKVTPNKDNSAYLEYDVYFKSAGTFAIDLYRMPTLNELAGSSMRCAIGIDDAAPVRFSGTVATVNNSAGTDSWGKGVLQNTEIISGVINVPSEGWHKVRLYNEDRGVVVDKFVITKGARTASYFGAPESYNSTYNTAAAVMPEASVPAEVQTGTITGMFDASLMIAEVKAADASGIEIGENSMSLTVGEEAGSGTAIIAAYNSDGSLKEIVVSTAVTTADGKAVYAFDKVSEGDYYNAYVWDSLNGMKPLAGKLSPSGDDITSVKLAKVKEIDSATVLAAAYDNEGKLAANAFVTADLSAVAVGGAAEVPLEFDIPEAARTVQIIVFDDFENMNVLAPSYKKVYDGLNLMASYDDEKNTVSAVTDLKEYIGRESMAVIIPEGTEEITSDSIIYIGSETVTDESYKNIRCIDLDSEENKGRYTLRIGVVGADKVFEEGFSTLINIQPDSSAVSNTLYSWNFDTDQTGTGTGVPTLVGNAVYDSANKAIKLTPTAVSGGGVTVDLDKAVTAAHGETITVVSKVAYGKLSKKYTDYTITDSNGKVLVNSHISAYATGDQSITIGDDVVYSASSGLITAIARNNNAISAGFTTYTTTIEPAANKITLVVSSKSGTETYTGKLPDGTSYDVDKIMVSTSYNNVDRSCYADDISISKSRTESYTIAFAPTDAEQTVISGAEISVVDAVTGAVVTAESDGTYKLCDGLYNYTVKAEGYADFEGVLELSPATPSKTIEVVMTK